MYVCMYGRVNDKEVGTTNIATKLISLPFNKTLDTCIHTYIYIYLLRSVANNSWLD